jgi:transposase
VSPASASNTTTYTPPATAKGFDQLTERRFGFIPFRGFLVFLLYSMRRVDCGRCEAVVVKEVPLGRR